MDTKESEDSKHAIADVIETYRQGFLQLNPELLCSIWDREHAPLIYVAMERPAPIYGWDGIKEYYAALPQHLEKMVAKKLDNIVIDLLGDTTMAFFHFHSTVRLKGHDGLFEPSGRVTMLFRRTKNGWRVIHFHESNIAARPAN